MSLWREVVRNEAVELFKQLKEIEERIRCCQRELSAYERRKKETEQLMNAAENYGQRKWGKAWQDEVDRLQKPPEEVEQTDVPL